MHRYVALVQGETLEEVKYHLKTKMGITEESYQHCELYPIYGTGQGSGNSPTIWLVISSVLFKCYEDKAYGAIFESPDRKLRMKLFRTSFVDDTTSYVNKFCQDIPPKPKELIAMLTHDSQLWSDLLWKSGGALELPKCSYHYWNYEFNATGRPVLQGFQVGPNVNVYTGDRSKIETVPSCSAYTAYKTLGYYKSPCGSQATQYSVLKKKCDNHARIVSTSAMTRREAFTYYYSMYLTSPGYPLPLCHFSPTELHSLETKSLPAILAKCGFNRKTSRLVIYGPVRLNGAGFRPFRTKQGLGQVQYFLKHWTSTLQPGKALRIAVSWAQFNTGVGWSIFDNVKTSLPHFESEWLRVLRDFLKSINARFRLDNPYVPKPQRINDSYIMDHVLASKTFKPIDICRINYCRLYLQAITVSDISTASGSRLFGGIHKGITTEITSSTTWHHIVQERPDVASWKIWNKALSLFSTNGILHTPLYE